VSPRSAQVTSPPSPPPSPPQSGCFAHCTGIPIQMRAGGIERPSWDCSVMRTPYAYALGASGTARDTIWGISGEEGPHPFSVCAATVFQRLRSSTAPCRAPRPPALTWHASPNLTPSVSSHMTLSTSSIKAGWSDQEAPAIIVNAKAKTKVRASEDLRSRSSSPVPPRPLRPTWPYCSLTRGWRRR